MAVTKLLCEVVFVPHGGASATGLTNLLDEVVLPQQHDTACDLSTPGKCTFPEFTARKANSYHLLGYVVDHITQGIVWAAAITARGIKSACFFELSGVGDGSKHREHNYSY